MNNSTNANPSLQKHFAEVFAQLREQEIEQFYAHYQLWLLRHRVPLIEKQIELLREHISENQRLLNSLRPSAIALAVLVRLQSKGVSNVELLDQMLERGEDWLDRMMQRLDYCEQTEDFIQGDYTQWCLNSLEGAYDWIDTVLGSTKEDNAPQQFAEDASQTTEEQILQKLRFDEDETILETTHKQPAILQVGEQAREEQASTPEEPTSLEEALLSLERETLSEAEASVQTLHGSDEDSPVAEMADWKDLESTEERPTPWYNTDLPEEELPGTGQLETMENWIAVLPTDDLPHRETGQEQEKSPQPDRGEPLPSAIASENVTPGTSENKEQEPAATVEDQDKDVAVPVSTETRPAQEITSVYTEEQNEVESMGMTEELFLSGQEEAIAQDKGEVGEPVGSDGSENGALASHSEIIQIEKEIDQALSANQDRAMPEELTSDLAREEITHANKTGERDLEQPEVDLMQEPPGRVTQPALSAGDRNITIQPDEPAEEDHIPATLEAGEKEEYVSQVPVLQKTEESGEAVSFSITSDTREEGERPWYEYLSIDEHDAPATPLQNEREEREETALVKPSARTMLTEHIGRDQNEAELSSGDLVHTEDSALPAQRENENDARQVWEMQQNDETQPMAFKELRLTEYAATQHTDSAELTEESETAAPQELEKRAEPAQIVPAPVLNEPTTAPATLSQSAANIPAEPSGKESQATDVTQSSPIAPPVTPISVEQPPKRVGFWRRLFGRKRQQAR